MSVDRAIGLVRWAAVLGVMGALLWETAEVLVADPVERQRFTDLLSGVASPGCSDPAYATDPDAQRAECPR